MIKKIIVLLCILATVFYLSSDIKSKDRLAVTTISVEVKGEVNSPGIYEMALGSTLADVLEICGLTQDSYLDSVSLSQVLYDSQVIVIPRAPSIKLISINSAGIDELCTLPGIGRVTAEKIIDYRNRSGCFHTLEELMNVKGIGKAKYEKIKNYITL